MHFLRSGFLAATALGLALHVARAREFDVVVYNVENLFDVDGVAGFEEYRPPAYGPLQLSHKIENLARVLQRFNNGAGPDIVMFDEIEADQTPDSTFDDFAAFQKACGGKTAKELLQAPTLDPALAGAPAQLWVAKQLADIGLAPYSIAVGRSQADSHGPIASQACVIFSRFPIVWQETYRTEGARGILEIVVEIDGHRLTLFDNHWKSAASDAKLEPVRIQNAGIMRRRLDEILRADPHADVIVGGDFNTQYNAKQVYAYMPVTAINDVLGSQGDELAMQRAGGPDLYNLWFELPNEKRGSDVWNNEWGTLMQIMLTRGLYDSRGVQYVENSFNVAAFRGLNADADSGLPIRWNGADGGSGFSDHLPIEARFRTVEDNDAEKWMTLTEPSRDRVGPSMAVAVRLPLDKAIDLTSWPADREFRAAENRGKLFKVTGRMTNEKPMRARVDGPGIEIMIYVRDPAKRAVFAAEHKVGDRVEFIGELAEYKGEWELIPVGEEGK